MQCTIKNPANYDLGDLESHIHGMYDHFASKYGFNKAPTVVLDSDEDNKAEILGKTAYYDPQSLEMHVFVDGRHSKDILRSIAHELIHHKQNLEGRLDVGGYSGPGYYLENDKLKEVEHEAMLEGNATMREYEDTVKYTETKNMSLKEWKNNELNQLLMKKFGILKEEKDVKMVPKSEVPEDAEVVVPDGRGDLVGIKKEELNEEELEEAHCMGKRDNELEEGGAAARHGNENHDVGKGRMTPDRIHEEELEEAEVEEGRKSARVGNEDKFVGHEDRYQNVKEGQLDELDTRAEDEVFYDPEGHAKRYSGQKSGDDNKDKKDSRAQELKEAINKITKAKRIFLNNKRIK